MNGPSFSRCKPLAGPKIRYDLELQPQAEKALAHLRERPSFRWWNRWFNKPAPFDRDVFWGVGTFLCRNIGDEISQAILREYVRVFGEEPGLCDL